MADQIDWIEITRFDPKPIGAIGFIGNDAVAVVAFYEDADANKDGKISWGEWLAFHISPISLKGMNVVEVAMEARNNTDVVMRDESFPQEAAHMFTHFASGMIADGIYAAYFARGVSAIGTGVAGVITKSMVKQFVVRKGFEAAVKKAFRATTH